MKKKRLLLLATELCILCNVNAGSRPRHMRTLGMDSPMGIESTPVFSWETESDERGFIQSAYQISVKDADGVEVWNSGKVNTSSQTNIVYQGDALKSRTAYTWSLKVFDGNDVASEERTSSFETAFLSADEWTARWITTETEPNAKVVISFSQPVNTRYVKIDATKLGFPASTDASYYYLQFAEVEIWSEGENVARNAIFTASDNWNYSTIWNLNYINDGIIYDGSHLGFTTHTMSNINQHVYIVADLGSEKMVSGVVLYPRQDDSAQGGKKACNFPASYSVQTSVDGKNYAVQYAQTDGEAPDFSTKAASVPYYGKSIRLPEDKELKRARLYASALGIFSMKINGQYVTENKLEPGESSFDKHVLYSTYDVTNLLQAGRNSLVASVAGGLFNVNAAPNRYTKGEIKNHGMQGFIAELFLEYSDGTTDHITTDSNWLTNPSPTLASNWYGGEDYDARKEIDGIDSPDFDFAGWSKVKEAEPQFGGAVHHTGPIGKLRAREYAPLRIVEEWKAVKVNDLGNGIYVVDFGRNFAGQFRMSLKGEAGQTIMLRTGELLNNDGTVVLSPTYTSIRDIYDTYTFKGNDKETWGPEFMYHGTRYLQITGLKECPSPENFTAQRIRANVDVAGTFSTSNALLNDIHIICRDGIQSQLYNTITDCPQREKLGWLDDPNEMYYSLCFNYDMQALLHKTVMDCFDSQYADGTMPSTAPHFMFVYEDDPNWGGAAVLVPYRSWKLYGDASLMREEWSGMTSLMKHYESNCVGNILQDRSTLSDWGQGSAGLNKETPANFTITTTYYYLLCAMSEMAAAQGFTDESKAYAQKATNVKNAFNKMYYRDGVYSNGNQAEYAMPLYYGLVADANEEDVARRLAEKVKADNYRFKTGEIGLKPVLMSLAKYGYNDIVYKMVNQTDYPSYGYWVKQGATTSPEYWDMSYSQNHCMMDHIEEWFFAHLSGIQNAGMAYDSLTISPWVPVGMASLNTTVQTVRGEVSLSYERNENSTTYRFSIPANATAKVTLPIVDGKHLFEGGKDIANGVAGVKSVIYTDSLAMICCGSGAYELMMNASSYVEEKEDTTGTGEGEHVKGEDVSSLYISNPSFELINYNTIPWTPTAWTLEYPSSGYGNISAGQRNVNPSDGTFYWHIWYPSNYLSIRLYQEIKGIVAGDYLLEGDMRIVDNRALTGEQRLFATVNGETTYSEPFFFDGVITGSSNNELITGWRTLSLPLSIAEDGTNAIIGFDCPSKNDGALGGFQTDNMRLWYLSNANSIHHVADINTSAPIYNLAGQRLSKLRKGINIVKGRKIFVRE